MSMTISPWQVASPTGHQIEGETFTKADHAMPNKAVLLVHGLTGSRHEHIHQQAAAYFVERDYAVLRFNLQSQDFRLRDCTIKTHGQDVAAVVAQKATAFEKFFIVGHSYGGPSVMVAQPTQATALCLWDPSFDLPSLWEHMAIEALPGGIGLMNIGGIEVVIGDAMVAEGHGADFDTEACLALSRQLNRPIQVVSASEGDEFEVYQRNPKSWHSAGHPANKRVLIPDSDHCFTTPQAEYDLLAATHDWFEAF